VSRSKAKNKNMENQHEKFNKEFLDFESKSDLFNMRVKGLSVWDHVRYKTYYDLLSSNVRENQISASHKKNTQIRFLRFFFSIFSFLFFCLFFFIRRNYDLVIIGDGASTNNNFHPIIRYFNKSNNILVLDISKKYIPYKKIDSTDYLNINFLVFLRNILKKLVRFSNKDDKTFKKISMLLRLNFDADINSKSLKEDFVQRSYTDYLFYSFILKRINTEKILLSDNGSSKGIIDAALISSVEVYNLQHGVISKYSILYNYNDSIDHSTIVKPSYMFTFGDYWNDKFNLPIERLSVGYPLHEQKKALFNTNSSELVKKEFSNLEKDKTFIIISSMHSGKSLESIVLRLASKLKDYSFIYKLRPNEYSFWKTVYSSELQDHPNIHVIDTDSYQLYDLFRISSYQIGVNSTAIIEGITFDLQTFILKNGWYLEMLPLIQSGYASLIESSSDVIENLNRGSNQQLDCSELFLKDSLHNIEKHLSL
jgi:hypothetical protein